MNKKHQGTMVKKAADILGGQSILAERLGVTPSAINQMVKSRRPVPADKCVSIEQATNGSVSRRDLRPDDWHLIWPELVTAEHPSPKSKESQ